MSRCNANLVPIVSLVALALAVSLSQVELQPTKPHGKEQMKSIRLIQTKLESIVKEIPGSPELDYLELTDASGKYEKWSKGARDGARSSPELRLVIDCAIAPMKRLGAKNLEEIRAQIKSCYTRFRLAYLAGRQVSPSTFRLSTTATERLCKKLMNRSSECLIYNDFVAGKKEAVELLNRMDELAEQGITDDNSEEFSALVNFFNDNNYKALFIDVYPYMKTSSDLAVLKKRFEKKMPAYGQELLGGKWKSVSLSNWFLIKKQNLLKAGFMYVI